MKYLILVLLFVSPIFAALPSAKEVKDTTDKFNAEKVKHQFPKLLAEIEEKIKEQSNSGFYSTTVDVSGYNELVVLKVSNILKEKGYLVYAFWNHYSGNQVLSIEW